MGKIKSIFWILNLWALIGIAGCQDGDTAFEGEEELCKPNPASARWGKTPGPVITVPEANQPANQILSIAGTCENGYEIKINGEGVEGESTADCLDGKFSARVKFTQGDDIKSVQVSQATFAEYDIVDRVCFLNDTLPPNVEIIPPNGKLSFNASLISVGGVCEEGLDVVLSGVGLSADVTTACEAGEFLTQVKLSAEDGLKTVQAQQVDRAGNTGDNNQKYFVDTHAPLIDVEAPLEGSYISAGATISGKCESGLKVQLLNGTQIPLVLECQENHFETFVTVSEEDGLKLIEVIQVDLVGNIGRFIRFLLKDTTAPVIAIESPEAGYEAANGVKIKGVCETDLDISISGAGLEASIEIPCVAEQFEQLINFGSGDGVKNVIVSQTDGAGNVGRFERDFSKDSIGPKIEITAPGAGSPVSTSVALSGDCETGYAVEVFGDGVAAVSSTACTVGRFQQSVELSVGDGSKVVQVAQSDAAGNRSEDQRTFNKDTESPVIQLTGPQAGHTDAIGVLLEGVCEVGLEVVISGSGLAPGGTTGLNSEIKIACPAGQFSKEVEFSDDDGDKTITASQTDLAGNTTVVSRIFQRDSIGPEIKFMEPAALTSAPQGLTLSGQCESGLTVTLSGSGLASSQTVNCVNGQFSKDILFSSGEGTKNILASQTDSANNVGSDTRNFIKDSEAPTLAILTPLSGAAVKDGVTIEGRCEMDLKIDVSGDGLASPIQALCVDEGFSIELVFTPEDGAKNISVTQIDGAGNSASDSKTYVKDSVAPIVAILSPAANSFVTDQFVMTGKCENGLMVSLSGDGLAARLDVDCVNETFSSQIALTKNDGVKHIIVSQTDEAGNSASDNRDFLKDGAPPVVKIVSPQQNQSFKEGLRLEGVCESDINVDLSGAGLGSPISIVCIDGKFNVDLVFSLPDGPKEIIVGQTDLAGNVASDSRTFFRDGTLPELAILAPSANSEFSQGLQLEGRCESGLKVSVSGAGILAATEANCENGQFTVVLEFSPGEGRKSITVSQEDSAGNQASDSRDFIKDSVAPTIAIVSPVENAIFATGLSLAGQCETDLGVSVFGSGIVAPTSTNCDNGSFAVELIFSDGEGVKDVSVSQKDSAGNSSTDQRSFERDSMGPDLAILAPAAGHMTPSGLRLEGRCESGLAVDLMGSGLTLATTTVCNQNIFSVDVILGDGDGDKELVVRQVDDAGNATTDRRIFVRDGSAPVLTIVSPDVNSQHQNQVSIAGSCESGLPITISGPGALATLEVPCEVGSFQNSVTLSVDDGVKSITVTQTDLAGNKSSDSRDFIKDSVQPIVKIQSPAASEPFSDQIFLAGICELNLAVNISGSGIISPKKVICNDGEFGTEIQLSAGDGNKTIQVGQIDLAGNLGSDERVFVRDSSAPGLSIASPVANSYFTASVNLAGICENGLKVAVMGPGVSALTEAECVNGVFAVDVVLSNGDGTKKIIATQTDLAGNQTKDERDFNRDSVAPILAIELPSADGFYSSGLTLSGVCETGLEVQVSGTGITSTMTATCQTGKFSVAISLSTGDGGKDIVVSQTDQAGNVGTDQRSFNRDSVAPNLAIGSPDENRAVPAGLQLTGNCESGLPVQLSGLGLASPDETACDNDRFNIAILLTDGDGTKSIEVAQTDLAGNTATDQRTFIRDSSAPQLAIISPIADSHYQRGFDLVGECESDFSVNIEGEGEGLPAEAACVGGSFNVAIVLSSGDGAKNIFVSQTDAAGNQATDQRNFILDTTAPNLIIEAPAANSLHSEAMTLSGRCESNLVVTLAGTGLKSPDETQCLGNQFSVDILLTDSDGLKNISVSQIDAVGNSRTDTRDFVRDSTAPSISITGPTANGFHVNGLTLEGQCESSLIVVISGNGLNAATEVACSNGQFQSQVLFSSGDGNKEIIVTQTDSVGNSQSDQRTFQRDTVNPVVTISSPDPLSTFSTQLMLEGQCETGLSVVVFDDLQNELGNSDCDFGAFSFSLVLGGFDGTKNIMAQQTDLAGNSGTDLRSFIKDTQAPALEISAPLADSLHSGGLTLTGICENGIPVELTGTGMSSIVMTNCEQGRFSEVIAFSSGQGSKQITVTQIDSAANRTEVSRNFINDSLAPVVAFNSPAENTAGTSGLGIAGVCESGLNVLIEGSGVAGSGSAVCNQGLFSTSIVFSPGEGSKSVTISQIDAAGNRSEDQRAFVKDNIAPVIQITAPAPNTFLAGQVTLAGNCESGIPVVVSGNGAAGVTKGACGQSKFSFAVDFSPGDGTKIFVVSQTDEAGNAGTDTRNFIQDTESPPVKITGPAVRSFASKGLTLTGTCEQGIDVNISGPGVKSNSVAACPEGGFFVDIELSEGEEIKNVVASQIDEAGNTGTDEREFIRDDGPPVLAITAPENNAITNDALTLVGTCETGLTVQISSVNLLTINTTCVEGVFNQALSLIGADGSIKLEARQIDLAGQIGTAARNFIKDTVAPGVTIASPAASSSAVTRLTISGQCETDIAVVFWGTGVDAESSAPCVGEAYSGNVQFSDGDGSKEIKVSQTDLAGNFSTVIRSFVRDSLAPVIQITSPQDGAMVISGFAMGGSCESGLTVRLSGSRLSGPNSTSCQGGQFSVSVNWLPGEGLKTIQVEQVDLAGNGATHSRNFITDETAPSIAILSPQAQTMAASGVSVTGTCETGLPVKWSGAGINTSGLTSTCANGEFSFGLVFSDGEGDKLVIASQTDASGNHSEAQRSFVKDSVSPAPTITSPAPQTAAISGLSITGTCESEITVDVSGSGLATAQNTSCSAAGEYSIDILFSAGDGEKTIVVSQTDLAGNIGSEIRNFVRDTQAPQIIILTPAENSVHLKNFILTGTCEVDLLVELSGDVVNARKIPCSTGQFSATVHFSGPVGAKVISVSQTDALGNQAQDIRNLIMTNATGKDTFQITGSDNQVDILFVDDNSASMEFEQRELGEKFASFADELVQLNWQIGVTTTDCSTGPFGICGSLLPLEGLGGQQILTPATPSFEAIFRATIERPETIDCVLTGTCPSGKEQALLSSMTAMSKRNSDNNGFFRNESDLAIVILSDEDEQSSAPASATKPQEVLDHFANIWPENKKVSVYGIVIQSGDEDCLDIQKEQSGGNAFYGTYVEQLAGLTSGLTVSICADNYNAALKKIGADVRKLTESVELSKVPITGTVQVNFIPAQNIAWTVDGTRVSFETSPQVGTTVEVLYEIDE